MVLSGCWLGMQQSARAYWVTASHTGTMEVHEVQDTQEAWK